MLLWCFSFSFFSFTQAVYFPKETKYFFNWGGKSTTLLVSQYGNRSDIVMINVHADEITSIEAGKMILANTGGMLIQVVNDEERLISFEKNGEIFHLDPNRIFTHNGLRKNFKTLNKILNKAAIQSVESFAKFILQLIPSPATTLIALHNNGDGEFSINSYKRHHENAKDAVNINISTSHDPDNFFLTTNSIIFFGLKAAGYNIVLQNNKKPTDDGSLSVYYGRNKRSYVNVEAESGKLNEQSEMLKALLNFLSH